MAASDGTEDREAGNRETQKSASERSDAAATGATTSEQGSDVVQVSTDVAQARAAAGEEFGHTIVTGLKIKIDPTTGKLSLQEDADTAAASVSDLPPVPVVEPGPVLSRESVTAQKPEATGSGEGATPASVNPASVNAASVDSAGKELPKPDAAASGNRRLSAETLFAFALPEAVVNAADEAMKLKTQASMAAPKLDDKASLKDGTTLKQSALGKIPKAKGMTPVILGLAVVALGGLLWVLFGEQAQKPSASASSSAASSDATESDISSETVSGGAGADAGQEAIPDAEVIVDKAGSAKNGASGSEVAPDLELTEAQTAAIVLLQSKDPRVVEAGIQSGMKLKDDLVTRRILSLVSDPNVFVRVAIAKVLVSPESYSAELKPEAVAALLQLLEDKDYLVRGYAARALGGTGERTALSKLTGRLDIETEEVVKKLIRASIDQIEKQ